MKRKKFQPNFLVNEAGKPIAVQLDIEEYKALKILGSVELSCCYKHSATKQFLKIRSS